MLLHGPVRVADDAMPGKATMVVRLPQSSKYASIPTGLEVVIE